MPDARSGHSAVSWRGELVLFGGSDAQHRFNDTWIMAVSVPAGGSARQLLATWRKLKVRADVRPPGRVGHTGSLVGDSLYVFGGCHGWAVQLDPIKPMLKASGTKRLKL